MVQPDWSPFCALVLLGAVGWVRVRRGRRPPGSVHRPERSRLHRPLQPGRATDHQWLGHDHAVRMAGGVVAGGSIRSTAGPSRTATLTAYLPMQVLPPGDWSGEQLTASSRYSNPANPMAAATSKDVPLETFHPGLPSGVGRVHPTPHVFWAPPIRRPTNVHYPTLDIQVTGDTWQAFGGGPVNCNSGTSESIETVLLPASSTTPGQRHGRIIDQLEHSDPGWNRRLGDVERLRLQRIQGFGIRLGSPPEPGVSDPVTATTATTSHVPLIAALVIAALAVLATLAVLLHPASPTSEPAPPEPTTRS